MVSGPFQQYFSNRLSAGYYVPQLIEIDDLKIAGFNKEVNGTFHVNMNVVLGEQKLIVNDYLTLIFQQTEAGLKYVHEHHSP